MADPLLGRTIAGRIRILALLGEGGMGQVYRGHHEGLDRAVAVKVLRPEVSAVAARVARFRREARAASRLEHPHVVRVYDYGEDGDGLLYLTMELVEGETLAALVSRELGLEPERAVRIVAQVLAAVAEAHDAGVVHRDLKPANVLIASRIDDDGAPADVAKVCDFGLARVLDDSPSDLTQEGQTLGTPAFMSPEQALGRPADVRSDVYAAGLVLFEALTGSPPFTADSPLGVMLKQVAEAPPRLSEQVPGIDGMLEDIVSWAIAKDPAVRCPSARQLRKALLGWLDTRKTAESLTSLRGPSVTGVPPGTLRGLAPEPLRRPTAPLIAAIAPTTVPVRAQGVVVLPLEARSAGAGDALFADAMTDALITALAKARTLRVISSTSSMRLRGCPDPLAVIAAQLGVSHVLEGSVVRAGDRVRIRARLIEAAGDAPAWAESYDRSCADVLALQDEVAAAIAHAIHAELSPAPTPKPVVPAAYDAYAEGRAALVTRTPGALRLALAHFRDAVALDPSFAAGHAGLADAYALLASYEILPPALALPKALAAAERAVALDEGLAEAHTAVAFATLHHHRDFERAEWSYRFAIDLAPGSADARQWYAELLAARGRHDEALRSAQAAQAIDPLSPLRDAGRALILYLGRRPEEAVEVAEAALARAPRCIQLHPVLSWALGDVGRHGRAVEVAEAGVALGTGFVGLDAALGYARARAGDEAGARAVLAELRARELTGHIPAFYRAAVMIGLDAREEALRELARAEEEGTGHLLFIGVDPAYDALRAEPAFQAIERRVLGTSIRSAAR